MALSTCVKCGWGLFEVVQMEPNESRFKLLAVQCVGCGGVVGVMDALNVGHMLTLQNEAIKRIAKTVGANVSDLL